MTQFVDSLERLNKTDNGRSAVEVKLSSTHFRNPTTTSGLAAELEALGADQGMVVTEEAPENRKRKKDKVHKKIVSKHKKNKICKIDIGSEKKTLLETDLTKNLSEIKESLTSEEQEALKDLVKKDQRREKRRLKRIQKKDEKKVGGGYLQIII